MTGLLALGLGVAGIMVIIGAKDKAGEIIRALFVIVLLACLAEHLFCRLRSVWGRAAGGWNGPWMLALAGAALVPLGWLLWRRRAERAKAHDLWIRRHGAARTRALSAPPSVGGDGSGEP